MAYGALETSVDSSIPIELYEFSYEGTTQYFTSADTNVTIGTTTYVSTQIARSELIESSDLGKNSLTLTCPDNFPIGSLFVTGPPNDVVTVTIKRVQQAELMSSDVIILWAGRITTVGFPPLRCEITCESVFTSLRAAGIHRVYSINCVFSLYGSECKVNQSSYAYTTTRPLTQTGNVFYGAAVSAFEAGYFAGGILVWNPASGLYITRGIKTHINGTSPQLEVTYEIPGFPSGGDVVTLYPGCDHSFNTCITKFSNSANYGGFPYMTQKNPWGDASIF